MPKCISKVTEGAARWVTKQAGSTWSFFLAVSLIAAWLCTGPIFNFSDTWQLIINTTTTIVTFVMVFLIQRTQNKDSFALQMKLNEIIAANNGCSNRLINVEDLSEEEVFKLYKRYRKLAELAKLEDGWTNPHTIEEIEEED